MGWSTQVTKRLFKTLPPEETACKTVAQPPVRGETVAWWRPRLTRQVAALMLKRYE